LKFFFATFGLLSIQDALQLFLTQKCCRHLFLGFKGEVQIRLRFAPFSKKNHQIQNFYFKKKRKQHFFMANFHSLKKKDKIEK